MRQLQKNKARKPARPKTREPLAEGIIPLRKNGQRDWSSISDDEIFSHVKRLMKENGISGRGELRKADYGLYEVLRRRKLLDKVGFEEKRQARPYGFFSKVSDGQLVAYAREIVEGKGISGRNELQKADQGLYNTLRKRKLLDRVGFEKKHKDWASMSDEELIAYTKKVVKKKGISGRSELKKSDTGLYEALRIRKLLDKVGFEERRRKMRDWNSLSDAQLVEYARKFMEEKGISCRKELRKIDCGLYSSLWRRNLLDRVFSDVEQAKEREEIQQIVIALSEF